MLATPETIRDSAQVTRLHDRLSRYGQVPLYRNRAGALTGEFSRLPLVNKQDLRAGFPANFLPEPGLLQLLIHDQVIELEHTSGTSGERLPVIFGRGWWVAQEERALRLNERVAELLDAHHAPRRATLTAPACNGLSCPAVWQSRRHRTVDQTRFLNLARIPFLLPESELDRMVAEVLDWEPLFLDLDPVHGAWFARHCARRGVRFPSVRFAISSYEFFSIVHRRLIEQSLGVPVFNLYGATETGHLLMENGSGEMKASSETAFLEVVAPGPDQVGELIVTTLANDYMPLLRYRIGDLAEQCVRPYATDYTLHGRSQDALRTPSGGRVTTWQVDQCFSELEGVAHYELLQLPSGAWRLRYVPVRVGLQRSDLAALRERLAGLLEAREFIPAESVTHLLPAPSGKFRLTRRIED